MGNLVRESLYNFNKTGDVKSDLNIGIRAKIKDWLDHMGIINYIINEDLTIDVDGNVWLDNKEIRKFPSFIKFRYVSGVFSCTKNFLTSLYGVPEDCGPFNCSGNKLINLKGSPKKVRGFFYCYSNHLINLDGLIGDIERSFSCSFNNLTSLVGSPPIIKGDFYVSNNLLTSLEGAPKVVYEDIDIKNNSKEFSIDEIKEVCQVHGKFYV